jgi:TonB family protein
MVDSKRHQNSSLPATDYWQPVLLSQPALPVRGMILSLIGHSLFLVLLGHLPFDHRSRPERIDFERENINYFRISDSFPDISPLARNAQTPKTGTTPPPVSQELPQTRKNKLEVQIHPDQGPPLRQIIDQPDVKQVKILPKLELPNILFQPSKTDRGVEAPVVLPELAEGLRQQSQALSRTELPNLLLNQAKTSRGIEPALLLPEVSTDFERDLSKSETAATNLAAKPHIAAPPPLPQSAMLLGESESRQEVKDLSGGRKAPLLAYSLDPALPKGELALPKAQTMGNLSVSPQAAEGTKPSAASLEPSTADIAIPDVSIRNQAPLPAAAAKGMVIQAPTAPPLPEQKPRELEKPVAKSLRDYIPSLTQPVKLQGAGTKMSAVVPDSPLAEAERKGLEIYTAAINAPNFTSKRGSWIFRFAEILEPGLPPLSAESAPAPHHSQLTAPSAIFKVDPRYPPEVIREKVEGVVILYAVIRRDGSVDAQSIRVLHKLDARLDMSARDALLGWKFKPSTKDGTPIDIQAEVSIPFYSHRDVFFR